MNLRPLLLPALSFVAGAAAVACFRPRGTGPAGVDEAPAEFLLSGRRSLGSGNSAGASSTPGISTDDILAFAGLKAPPTLDDIFQANGLDRSLRMAVFLQTAASADLEAVIARCREMKISDNSLTDQVWLRWVEIDREAAFKADPGGYSVWPAWARLDPATAVAAAAQAKPQHLLEVIRSIGQGDPAAAVQLLSEYPAADTPQVWSGILEGLGKTDPGAAAALALEKNIKPEVQVAAWVARDPGQALAWVRGLEDPIQRRRALDAAVKELTLSDPAAALRESAGLPTGRSRTERTAEAIAALSRTDPAAARQAAESLTNPPVRQHALSELAETLAARDPAAALAIVSELSWAQEPPDTLEWSYTLETGGGSSSTSSKIDHQGIRQLMQTSPEATVTALAAIPEDRKPPISSAMQSWAASQPEAASQWLNRQPAGPAKDQAIGSLTHWLARGSPEPDFEAALSWAGAASTPELQFRNIQNIMYGWSDQDRKAARAAVDRLPLSPERREEILRSLK